MSLQGAEIRTKQAAVYVQDRDAIAGQGSRSRALPETPVVACWIEGGWGSYTSYFDGPPTVNKHPDWWRRVRVGMAPPRVLDAKLLSDQRAARAYLMQMCLDTREYLGLPHVELPYSGDDGSDTDETTGA